ncbi:hypothetical protein SDC9_133870 [bioreactor metagenome]|uniref:Uncharacterized protein n=1 Tax=bioreactor metagenome TaxID=1076179 RepID=A0A645DCM8_9ZZZZ
MDGSIELINVLQEKKKHLYNFKMNLFPLKNKLKWRLLKMDLDYMQKEIEWVILKNYYFLLQRIHLS